MDSRMEQPSKPRSGLAALLLVCLLAVSLAGMFWQQRTVSKLREENYSLSNLTVEVERLRKENEHTARGRIENDEIERLRKDNQDLHKLRNEVRQLREMQKEAETLRAENLRLRTNQQRPSVPVPNLSSRPGPDASASAAWLGIGMRQLANLDDSGVNRGTATGVAVGSVPADSPAAKAGILPGDIVTAIDGQVVTTPQELQAAVSGTTIGQTIILDIIRAGQNLRVPVQTVQRPR
jgi:predicted metalloprotease with PDZ domain